MYPESVLAAWTDDDRLRDDRLRDDLRLFGDLLRVDRLRLDPDRLRFDDLRLVGGLADLRLDGFGPGPGRGPGGAGVGFGPEIVMSEQPPNCSPQAVCQNHCMVHFSQETPAGKLKVNSWSPCSMALAGKSPAPSAFAR